MKHKYIAVDFDGTIVDDDYPAIGAPKPDAIRVLKRIVESGGQLMLWTCREGMALHQATQYLLENGIHLAAINGNHHYLKLLHNTNPRKIGADLYIDDKALMRPVDWLEIENYLFEEDPDGDTPQ